MPDNPLKGRYIFEQKGCIGCHSISGDGGETASDLGKKKFYGTFLELASIMWNHVPDMLRQMRELNLPFPEFSRTEMGELTSYLYYLRYLGEPGNLYRGKILVKEKGCLTCHSIGDNGKDLAPAFDKLSKYISPLYLAQALWNHGPEMETKLSEAGLSRPKFEKGEIVDLSAYIRAASKGTDREQIYMSPGNPQHGKQVYKDKGCFDCHAINGKGSDSGPDLSSLEWGYSITEIAGLMWNHGSVMGELMKERNLTWPKFNGQEMADLIAFLYFLKFADKPGDPDTGEKLFAQKGCGNCHGKNTDNVPDLSTSEALSSTIDIAQIMWNHAPVMEERILEKDMHWPQFTGTELSHLYAYLITKKTKTHNK
jgi:cytochrome c551/c552